MKIAELFVQLGFKGGDQAKKQLQSVSSGLGEAKSMALETKAAILGVMYGLQQLMSKSGQAGRDFSQFNAITGQSAETLQRWQYAGRQFNVESEEMVSNVKSVQDAMTNMLQGKGAPDGYGLVANTVGINPEEIRDTYYVLEQLQKFAQTVSPDIGKNIVKSFGVSDSVFAAMRKNAFNPDAFKKANIYTDKESESLRKIEVGWMNLGDKISKSLGHLNSKHGLKLMNDIDMIATKVLKLIDAFIQLGESIKVFKVIGMVFEGWGKILDGANATVGELKSGKYNNNPAGGPVASMLNEALKGAGQIAHGAFLSIGDNMQKPKINPKAISPRMDASKINAGNKTEVQVNQNLNFQHSGKDHKKTGDSVRKANKEAYNQLAPQITGGN